jgi:hypothetical protein
MLGIAAFGGWLQSWMVFVAEIAIEIKSARSPSK